MRSTAPYGSWTSPLRAARIAAGARRLVAPRLWRGRPCWLESVPAEGGRMRLVAWEDGAARELSPPGADVRTRVHEYGGGEVGEIGGVLAYSDLRLPGIQRLGGAPVPATLPDARYADFVGSPDGRFLLAVEEHPAAPAAPPVNRLVAFDLVRGRRLVVVDGVDFVSSPRFAPSGERAVCLVWDHPSLPWLGTRLLEIPFGSEGPTRAPRALAGGLGESLFQPEFGPDGTLSVVSDRTGWWNLHRVGERGLTSLHARSAEFGQPQWVFGMSRYAFVAPGVMLCAYFEAGRDRLARLDLASGQLAPLALPYTEFEGVRTAAGKAVFVAASPTSPQAVCELDLASGRCAERACAFDEPCDPGWLSVPEAVEIPSAGGRRTHAYLYRPKNDSFAAPPGSRPPLVLKSHGGPTSATSASLRLGHQFWTSRGFALLDVDYGGSTGYGRPYRERLHGAWGVVDVEDCAYAARWAADEGLAERSRIVATGGSAGGYTTLCLLAFRDECAAGASHYGIGDLALLAQDTHKFEARYTDWLVGPWPEAAAVYAARSPLRHLECFARPVIFFQGREDRVVPPAQAEAMAAALAARGVPHALVEFPDEGHGFRRAESIERALAAELWFYGRVLGFPVDTSPAPPLELR